ncbi:helix-turn-helix transcriptional regulator [Pedobacter hiemivivus]|uniref:YafY family transcriptional regulator n=1 Tax=Pedobacter hiemivivus TaxID=2530454 RepID=A0A4V2MJY9_9SPHI|nr:YafY family protein [Pedobacter hiemivivus]TCC96196.1 YafY family transcriptional regulator [Pedobacter hiemivivus]
MNRIDRLFGILLLLQTKKYISADKIADQFQISTRTVYRDIKALLEQGVPISFEQPRGYYIVQGYFLPPVSFSSDEANALLIMERMVSRFADKSIFTNYTSALNKVKAVLKHAQKEKLELLNESIKFQLNHEWMNEEFDHLADLQNAISGKYIIEIDYQNQNKESSKREVEAIGLVFYAYNWHLIAWCHLRNEYRDFRVSRIVKVRNLEIPYRKTVHMALNEYMKSLPVNY